MKGRIVCDRAGSVGGWSDVEAAHVQPASRHHRAARAWSQSLSASAMRQRLFEAFGIRKSVRGVLCEAPQDDVLDVLRDALSDLGRRHHRVVGVRDQEADTIVDVEGRVAREQVVRDGAERVDVAAAVDRLVAGGLLGRHEQRRAEDPGFFARVRCALLHDGQNQAEVEQLGDIVGAAAA